MTDSRTIQTCFVDKPRYERELRSQTHAALEADDVRKAIPAYHDFAPRPSSTNRRHCKIAECGLKSSVAGWYMPVGSVSTNKENNRLSSEFSRHKAFRQLLRCGSAAHNQKTLDSEGPWV